MSWCGRKPQPEIIGVSTPTPTVTPSPSAATAPTPTPSPSATPQTAQASATPTPNQASLLEFRKIAGKINPGVVALTIFDSSGQLLRNGTGFFVSADGRLITNLKTVDRASYAVAKSADGKIRNVSGILVSSDALDLAVLKADTKVGVPFLRLSKRSAAQAGSPVAVFGSPLVHRDQPLAAATVSEQGTAEDQLQISASLSNEALGSPVIDQNGEVAGVVTSAREQGATVTTVRPSSTLDSLLTRTKPGMTGRWGTATNEPALPGLSPSPQPTPKMPTENRKIRLVYTPAPKYPTEARLSRVSGSGRFRIVFGPGGEARNVETVQSTGQHLLDQAAISALRQWKAAPGGEGSVVVPITFQP
jgi:TonB family protein